ncbi:MAG: hypothetical protein AAF525_13120, partial [Pseudomonadota bacterium]
CWPTELLSFNKVWHHEDRPRWCIFGEIASALTFAHSDAMQYFINQCYCGKTLSAAFGINFHLGRMTSGHLTGL